jgi:hypothetical protein
MSSRRDKIIAYTAIVFAGISVAEVVSYTTLHQTIYLVGAAIAAIIVVLIIGTTALVARRTGKPPKAD